MQTYPHKFRLWSVPNLDGPAIRNANRGDSRESIRRKKKNIFITCERFARIASNLRFAIFSPPPPSPIRNKGVRFSNPETIRENQAIRANLRIDSRESGHLRSKTPRLFAMFFRGPPVKVRDASSLPSRLLQHPFIKKPLTRVSKLKRPLTST